MSILRIGPELTPQMVDESIDGFIFTHPHVRRLEGLRVLVPANGQCPSRPQVRADIEAYKAAHVTLISGGGVTLAAIEFQRVSNIFFLPPLGQRSLSLHVVRFLFGVWCVVHFAGSGHEPGHAGFIGDGMLSAVVAGGDGSLHPLCLLFHPASLSSPSPRPLHPAAVAGPMPV